MAKSKTARRSKRAREADAAVAVLAHRLAASAAPGGREHETAKEMIAALGTGAPSVPGVVKIADRSWQNYGKNVEQRVRTTYMISNGVTNDANVAIPAIQWAVRDVGTTPGGCVAAGMHWSFSRAGCNATATIDTTGTGKWLTFSGDQLADPTEVHALFHVQAGTRIEQLLAYVEGQGRALIAMGGNCGQTIAGAVSTGTHGGFLDRPGFPDAVRALWIVGEGGALHWIEPTTRPVASNSFAAALSAGGVTVHHDNSLFQHALGSLGAFGVIASLVIETVPAYRVKLSRAPTDFDSEIDAALFDHIYKGPAFGGGTPIDLQVVVNPFRMTRSGDKWNGPGAVTIAQLTEVPLATPIAVSDPGPTLNDGDIGTLLATFSHALPGAIPGLIDLLVPVLYGKRQATGPLSVAYPLSITHAPTLSMEIGVDSGAARQAFGILIDFMRSCSPPLPGVFSVRQTLRSRATLSIAHWPRTYTFELALLGGVGGTETTLASLLDRLVHEGIAFRLHLGMLVGALANGSPWLTRERMDAMYGAQVITDWHQARRTISPNRVFTNALLGAVGL
jgi:hypothetical protein